MFRAHGRQEHFHRLWIVGSCERNGRGQDFHLQRPIVFHLFGFPKTSRLALSLGNVEGYLRKGEGHWSWGKWGGGGSHTSDASDDPGVTTNKKSVRFAKNRGVDKVPGRKRQHSCVSPNRDPFMNIICVIRIPADGAGGGKLASAELEAGPRARTVDRMDGVSWRWAQADGGPVRTRCWTKHLSWTW